MTLKALFHIHIILVIIVYG